MDRIFTFLLLLLSSDILQKVLKLLLVNLANLTKKLKRKIKSPIILNSNFIYIELRLIMHIVQLRASFAQSHCTIALIHYLYNFRIRVLLQVRLVIWNSICSFPFFFLINQPYQRNLVKITVSSKDFNIRFSVTKP